MPLSPPAERRQYHTRDIQCRGYFRADGLWDIEGQMTDVKTYDFSNSDRGEVKAGEPVHAMHIRLTLDDSFEIKAVEAATDHGPFSVCAAIAPSYEKLVGVKIGPGFRKAVKDRLGGVAGCTHLTELLYPMATVAYQTLYASRNQARRDAGLPVEEDFNRPKRKPRQIDSCHALRADGPVVRDQWPDFFEGPEPDRRS
jgi:hypothetical protein